MRVELTPQLEAEILEKVESGAYPDATSVVTEALALLNDRDNRDLDRLRAEIKLGFDQIDRGEGIPYTPELHDQIIESARQRART